MGIKRAAKTTDLRNQLAFNRVGPALKHSLLHLCQSWDLCRVPSQMGMYAGLLQGAIVLSVLLFFTPGYLDKDHD